MAALSSNIFLCSDASFDIQTSRAGLAVLDLSTRQNYVQNIMVKSSHEAEFFALLLSVKTAIKLGYDNVVFLYDNLTLDIAPLDNYLQSAKHSLRKWQFLWVKRGLIQETDAISKLAKKNAAQIPPPFLRGELTNKELYLSFMKYDTQAKMKILCTLANHQQKRVLDSFMKGHKDGSHLQHSKADMKFYKKIYHFFTKQEKEIFIHYLKTANGIQLIPQFKSSQKQSIYIEFCSSALHLYKELHSSR